MHFAIVCTDKPDSVDVRKGNRSAHLDYLKSYNDHLLAAGPLLADDGETPAGSLLLMAFDDIDAARTFADGDPYNQAGLFKTVTICPWRKVFPEA